MISEKTMKRTPDTVQDEYDACTKEINQLEDKILELRKLRSDLSREKESLYREIQKKCKHKHVCSSTYWKSDDSYSRWEAPMKTCDDCGMIWM